jgi:hypothetical protein
VTGSLTTDDYQGRNSADSRSRDQTTNQKKSKKINQTVANIKENEYTPIEIILSSIPTHIWQPQRWQMHS